MVVSILTCFALPISESVRERQAMQHAAFGCDASHRKSPCPLLVLEATELSHGLQGTLHNLRHGHLAGRKLGTSEGVEAWDVPSPLPMTRERK